MGGLTYPNAKLGALYDKAQVEEYLSALFRNVEWAEGELLSVLGIGEKGTPQEGVFRERQIIPPAMMHVAHKHLRRWSDSHVAGFMVPAVLKAAALERGDVKLDMVASLTAIVLDIDSGDTNAKRAFVTSALGTPSLVVGSGGVTAEGTPKLHCYWLLNEPSEEVERVAFLRKLLAMKCGGDQSFGRATQVIRVPGTVHAKNGKAALCSILARSDCEYSLDDMAETIEAMQPMPGLPEPVQSQLPALVSGGMDFTPRQDTALAAMHRDIDEGGSELTRWGEFSKIAGFNISECRAGRITPEAAKTATNGWMLTHMNPPWPQARFDQEFMGLVNKDVANHGAFPQSVIVTAIAIGTDLRASPARFPDPRTIPPRPWMLGRWLQRGIVTAVIAPGGVGKSSLMAALTLSMSSGKPILGKTIYGGPLRTWYWNLEDSGDNLARARIAAMMHHGIGPADLGDRMFVDSGPDGAGLCVAVEDRAGFTIIVPVFEALKAAMIRDKVDLLVIDPFVSCHQIDENDNNRVDAVIKMLARIAVETNAAIAVVHHSRKMNGDAVTGDSARGASALNNAARTTLVLNRMTPEQAEGWGIELHRSAAFFNVADDKHNMAPAERADWFEIVGVSLDNAAGPHEADSVGVVQQWTPPQAMDGVTADHLLQVQRVLCHPTNCHWESFSDGWAGEVVATILKLEASEPRSKKKIAELLKVWTRSGALKREMRRDEKKTDKRFRPALVSGPLAINH